MGRVLRPTGTPPAQAYWGAIVLRTGDRFKVLSPDDSADMVARAAFDRVDDLAHVFVHAPTPEGFWAVTRIAQPVRVQALGKTPWSDADGTSALRAVADHIASPAGWGDQARAQALRARPRGTREYRPAGYAHNAGAMLALAVLAVSLTGLPGWVREARRRRAERSLARGRCPECGYSIQGLASAVCPECGVSLNPPGSP
jgi:hypothetical protein